MISFLNKCMYILLFPANAQYHAAKKYFIKKESQIMMTILKNNKFYKKKGEIFNIYDRNILQNRKS